jgi:hypothetical protein
MEFFFLSVWRITAKSANKLWHATLNNNISMATHAVAKGCARKLHW